MQSLGEELNLLRTYLQLAPRGNFVAQPQPAFQHQTQHDACQHSKLDAGLYVDVQRLRHAHHDLHDNVQRLNSDVTKLQNGSSIQSAQYVTTSLQQLQNQLRTFRAEGRAATSAHKEQIDKQGAGIMATQAHAAHLECWLRDYDQKLQAMHAYAQQELAAREEKSTIVQRQLNELKKEMGSLQACVIDWNQRDAELVAREEKNNDAQRQLTELKEEMGSLQACVVDLTKREA